MNIWNAKCVNCEKPLYFAHHGICSDCLKTIPHPPYCATCGANMPFDSHFCGLCSKSPILWQQIVRVSSYEAPIKQLIHRFKFHQQYWLDQSLARLLYLAIRQAKRTHQLILPEVLVPIPLTPKRQWQRGYNQSELLARYLSRWLSIPLDNQLIQRIKHTHTQRGLSSAQRRSNLKHAFQVLPTHYHSIALIDDVITTGSTMNEVCRQLQQQGIKHIQVWVLCRA